MKNGLVNMTQKMDELLLQREHETEEIRQKLNEARTELESASMQMMDATSTMDLEAFQKAKKRKDDAETAVEMYRLRLEQFRTKEYIAETESDAIIDGLLAFEDELSESFKDKLDEHLTALCDLYNEYTAEVERCETALRKWESEIHVNYRSFGRSHRTDEDGNTTERMLHPSKVHPLPFIGCAEAVRLGSYLAHTKE